MIETIYDYIFWFIAGWILMVGWTLWDIYKMFIRTRKKK